MTDLPPQNPYADPLQPQQPAPAYSQPPAQPGYAQPAYGQPAPAQPAYGQPAPYQPAPGSHGQQGAYQQPVDPALYHDARYAGATQCAVCGSIPAAKATFRGHRGIIVLMQFLSQKGPFCRDCGISTFRTMTSRTLVQGWWGYASLIATPVTLLINLFQRPKVAKLPPPIPSPDGNSTAPLPIGKPVYQRPTIIGLAVPLAVVCLFGALIVGLSNSPTHGVGGCVTADGTDSFKWVHCTDPHDGKVVKEGLTAKDCGDLSVAEEWRETSSGRKTGATDYWCVDEDL